MWKKRSEKTSLAIGDLYLQHIGLILTLTASTFPLRMKYISLIVQERFEYDAPHFALHDALHDPLHDLNDENRWELQASFNR